jgi:phosphohistidine phosphatase
MRLYFLRHGDAEEGRPDLPDMERRLTPEGKEELAVVARGMKQLGVKVDRILTSPARRAQETAAIAAAALGGKQLLLEDARLSPGCGFASLRSLLAEHPADRVMLVGHEPDFSSLIATLTGAGQVDMKKAGLARLDLEEVSPGSAILEWLLPPKVLTAVGGHG